MDLLINKHTGERISSFSTAPSHGLGLRGAFGAGKGYLAEYVAAKLLHTELSSLQTHPYIWRLNVPENKIGIDNIRELHEFLKLRVPGGNPVRRVVIIEYAEYLGHEAQNALLKTLEEPPIDTLIIITYDNKNRLLPTILSRVQEISVLPVDENTIVNHLSGKFPQQELKKAVHISGGSAGLLLAILNESDEHPLMKAIEQARALLRASKFERIAQTDKIIKNKDVSLQLLLDAMYRLLHAGYVSALGKPDSPNVKSFYQKLARVEEAINDLDANLQAKLVVSRLFYEL